MTKEKGLDIISIMRDKEKKARLNLWKHLMEGSAETPSECPFTEEPPEGAIFFGVMPVILRGPFARAYELRRDRRDAEAGVFEEAIGELLQEHFDEQIRAKKERGDPPIGRFQLGKDWAVYAVPLS
jgi:hypothetical protein